ncbi:hypothetical protein [Desulfobacula sp.]|uniref:hypothetical protein n=1 Tax=Desulfobacula sp. TaxID=2593537 RepID=UPI002608A350|nr:hypothetical protein [Desulfobacula sp.]
MNNTKSLLGLDHRFGQYPGGVRLALLTLLLNFFAITVCYQKHNNTSLTPSNHQLRQVGEVRTKPRFCIKWTTDKGEN